MGEKEHHEEEHFEHREEHHFHIPVVGPVVGGIVHGVGEVVGGVVHGAGEIVHGAVGGILDIGGIFPVGVEYDEEELIIYRSGYKRAWEEFSEENEALKVRVHELESRLLEAKPDVTPQLVAATHEIAELKDNLAAALSKNTALEAELNDSKNKLGGALTVEEELRAEIEKNKLDHEKMEQLLEHVAGLCSYAKSL